MNIDNMSKEELVKLKTNIENKLETVYDLNEKFEKLSDMCNYYFNCGKIMKKYVEYCRPNRYSTIYYSELLHDFPEDLYEFIEELLICENTVKIFSDKFNKEYTIKTITDIVKQIEASHDEDVLFMELWENIIKEEAVYYGYKGVVVDW
jgi:uncharacterized membrane protein YgaE (UPF0421/DUF939 family)